jgi:hypothetical protein
MEKEIEKAAMRERALKRMSEIYPLANEDDYPDNPQVNKINHRCRSAFMSGVEFVINNWQKEQENAELAAANKRIKELDDMYLKLSQKYADLYEKRK